MELLWRKSMSLAGGSLAAVWLALKTVVSVIDCSGTGVGLVRVW